jgi:hypothetical protein
MSHRALLPMSGPVGGVRKRQPGGPAVQQAPM